MGLRKAVHASWPRLKFVPKTSNHQQAATNHPTSDWAGNVNLTPQILVASGWRKVVHVRWLAF